MSSTSTCSLGWGKAPYVFARTLTRWWSDEQLKSWKIWWLNTALPKINIILPGITNGHTKCSVTHSKSLSVYWFCNATDITECPQVTLLICENTQSLCRHLKGHCLGSWTYAITCTQIYLTEISFKVDLSSARHLKHHCFHTLFN